MQRSLAVRPPAWLRTVSAVMRRIGPFRGRVRITNRIQERLAGRGWSDLVVVNGYQMLVLLDDLIGRSTYVDGVWERANTAAAVRLLAPGGHVFDIGANAGYFALLFASRVGADGEVVAFEPVRETADRLRANLTRNPAIAPRVRLMECAVSSVAGTVEMAVDRSGNTGASHVLASGAGTTTGEGRTTVVCRTADEVWEELGQPGIDLVKIDIEGHELFALRGMSRVLNASPKVSVLIEVRDRALRETGGSRDAVFALMQQHGFNAFDFAEGNFVRNDEPRDGELIVFSKRSL